jgi:hypothetical protein
VSSAALGTRSNFTIGADRIRCCSIASCCDGNVIAKHIGPNVTASALAPAAWRYSQQSAAPRFARDRAAIKRDTSAEIVTTTPEVGKCADEPCG